MGFLFFYSPKQESDLEAPFVALSIASDTCLSSRTPASCDLDLSLSLKCLFDLFPSWEFFVHPLKIFILYSGYFQQNESSLAGFDLFR